MSRPLWLSVARTYVGTSEIPGPKHNSTIQRWLTKLGAWWVDDETPWCGVFCAAVMQQAFQPYPKMYMRAKAWETYGEALSLSNLAPGAILVFMRQGGGHVGFYVGEDRMHYHVLGGNQRNSVNVMRIAKNRITAARWPRGVPLVGGPVYLTSSSAGVSTNEA